MKARLLPTREWGRLPMCLSILDHVNTNDVDVIAVEAGGEVVACVAVMKLTHLEGAWIDPSRRGHAGIARMLLRETLSVLKERASGWALIASENPTINRLCANLGAMPLLVSPEMKAFALEVGKEDLWRQYQRQEAAAGAVWV